MHIVMAIGADAVGVLVGRLVFAVVVTALVARLLRVIPEEAFLAWAFQGTKRPVAS